MNYHDYSLIPEHMMISLNLYVEHGCPIGGFLTAVMSNDLWRATANADATNLPLIPVYVNYIHNKCPMGCHGSPEHVKEWYEKKREETKATTTAETEKE